MFRLCPNWIYSAPLYCDYLVHPAGKLRGRLSLVDDAMVPFVDAYAHVILKGSLMCAGGMLLVSSLHVFGFGLANNTRLAGVSASHCVGQSKWNASRTR